MNALHRSRVVAQYQTIGTDEQYEALLSEAPQRVIVGVAVASSRRVDAGVAPTTTAWVSPRDMGGRLGSAGASRGARRVRLRVAYASPDFRDHPVAHLYERSPASEPLSVLLCCARTNGAGVRIAQHPRHFSSAL